MGVREGFWVFPISKVSRKLKVLRRHDLACSSHPKYLHVSGICCGSVFTQRGHWGNERKGKIRRPWDFY